MNSGIGLYVWSDRPYPSVVWSRREAVTQLPSSKTFFTVSFNRVMSSPVTPVISLPQMGGVVWVYGVSRVGMATIYVCINTYLQSSPMLGIIDT